MNQANILKRLSTSVIVITFSLSCLSLLAQKKKRVFTTKEVTDSFFTEKLSFVSIDSFIVKFTEGTKIRQRGDEFLRFNDIIKPNNILLPKDNQLTLDDIYKELFHLNTLLKGFKNKIVKRYFERSEQEIDQEKDSLENKINEELADLNLYYLIVLRSGDAKQLIDSLNNFKIVENAYPVYKAENAFFTNGVINNGNKIHFPAEFSDQQEYLNAAPKGINAKYAWTINGGKGDGVKIIDIEDQWDIIHEDLKPPFWMSTSAVASNGSKRGDHGTAVLGEIIAKHNQFGVKGISPEAAYGISGVSTLSIHTRAVSSAIDKATRLLKAGDIILIEQHTPGPSTGKKIDSTCNPEQFEYVPMEYYQDCFDAIRRATAKGIIVVEAAGNGGINLDMPLYKKLFNRNIRDSKAIFVAADEGGNGIATCWTNYGSRIDFFGWGKNIVTTGYGGFPDIPINSHKKYTNAFGGTSGASPIIVGAIACIQGIRKKMGLGIWTTDLIRANLIGTPQFPGDKFIGLMPDLKLTIQKMNLFNY